MHLCEVFMICLLQCRLRAFSSSQPFSTSVKQESLFILLSAFKCWECGWGQCDANMLLGEVLMSLRIFRRVFRWRAAVQRGATLSALAYFILFPAATVWAKNNVPTDLYFCTRKGGSRVRVSSSDSSAEKFFLLGHLGQNA